VFEHSFEYNRINNSDYSYVQDQRGRELIHDEARIAIKDSKKYFSIQKSVARDLPYYPKPYGKPDGPLDARFNLPDKFDKTSALTRTITSGPAFSKQL
jgi:hypothetical protein